MLERDELILLEECLDDWQGLWEAVWMAPDEPVEKRATLVTSLVQRGLLDILRLNEWSEARAATALPREEALAVVREARNYIAPAEGHVGQFFVLSITPEGEAAQAACYS